MQKGGFLPIVRYILFIHVFASRRRHTRCLSDWSSDVCSSDLLLTELRSLTYLLFLALFDFIDNLGSLRLYPRQPCISPKPAVAGSCRRAFGVSSLQASGTER